MSRRVIDIATAGRSLRVKRGFLEISAKDAVITRIPIDDIATVIVSASGAMLSTNLMARLSENGASIVTIGQDFAPCMIMLPCAGHHDQGRRMRAQADSGRPVRKRLWAQLVRAKISAQAAVLERKGVGTTRLHRLAKEVKSGDPDNREAVAAQFYWPALFNDKFLRNRNEPGTNAMLNYGYAVLRSCVARAIVSAGLHPSLSLHHVSNADAYCLADDLMEPFRPAVDLVVISLTEEQACMDDPETRSRLVGVLDADYDTSNGRSPLNIVAVRLAQSLASVFEGTKRNLLLPDSAIPMLDEAA